MIKTKIGTAQEKIDHGITRILETETGHAKRLDRGMGNDPGMINLEMEQNHAMETEEIELQNQWIGLSLNRKILTM